MMTWVAAVTCLVVVVVGRPDSEHYADKYDKMNINEVLSNQRSYKWYFDCLIDRGQCPPAGKELKDVLPDAIRTTCGKCTDSQKEKLRETFTFLEKNKSEDLGTLLDFYDSEKKYREDFIKFIKSED